MTKNLIKDSLLDLLNNHNVSDVTVSELCEKANVNRSTFYRHYNTPHDVLIEIMIDWQNGLEAITKTQDTTVYDYDYHLEEILNYNIETERTYAILLKETEGITFLKRTFEHMGIIERLDARLISFPKDERKYLKEYILWGTFKTIECWALNGHKESSKEMAKLINNFINKTTGFKI